MPCSAESQRSCCPRNVQEACVRALELLATDIPALEEPIRRCREQGGEASRRLLGDFLIQFSGSLSEGQLQAIDEVYAAEALSRPPPLSLDALEGLWLAAAPCKILVWRGDITQLAADVVVNAANEEGLGCFQPTHRCIDNVLHRGAGPRLRRECRNCMERRPGKLMPGTMPLLTKAYHLPAKAMLHVTGPQISPGSRPSSLSHEQLRLAYANCLDAARDAGLRSVAFCCISTGLFGYPAREAAECALTAVHRWLQVPENLASMSTIVFDVFTEHDEQIYHDLGPQIFHSSSRPI
ncbi:unnamed protein product [Symbiodinium pilosum]|uniref:Macro domain-containing protein n=1 Tax=Symbiodinium pilosum TaxID=2952 RepID=A0A812W0Y2_SYMPI|nr:unnamed protein product [Symbiodinium pilosum]